MPVSWNSAVKFVPSTTSRHQLLTLHKLQWLSVVEAQHGQMASAHCLLSFSGHP